MSADERQVIIVPISGLRTKLTYNVTASFEVRVIICEVTVDGQMKQIAFVWERRQGGHIHVPRSFQNNTCRHNIIHSLPNVVNPM